MKSIFYFLFLFVFCDAYAQRPMSKVKILQKLDSIVFEADRLYCYMNASQVTKNLFKENYGISITDTAFLTYTIKDTLKCIQHQAESDIIYEAVFELDSCKLIHHRVIPRRLTDMEDSLL